MDEIERRHEFVQLSSQEVERLLLPVSGGRRVLSFELLREGRNNTNYKVCCEGAESPLLLRIFPPGSSVCAKERDIARRLEASSLPIRTVLHADTDGEVFGRPYLVAPWVEGVSLEVALRASEVQSAARWGALTGEVLARLREVTFPLPGDLVSGEEGAGLDVVPWEYSGQEVFCGFAAQFLFDGCAAERLGQELAQEVWAFVKRESPRLDGVLRESFLAHGDFKPENLVVGGNLEAPRILVVLDWEYAHSGTQLGDFANLMRDEALVMEPFVSSLVDAYLGTGGELPPQWRALSRLVDILSQLEFLSSRSPRGAVHVRARERLTQTLRGWESYLAR